MERKKCRSFIYHNKTFDKNNVYGMWNTMLPAAAPQHNSFAIPITDTRFMISPYSLYSSIYSLSAANPTATSSTCTPSDKEASKPKSMRSYNPGRPLCIEDRQRIVRLYEQGNRVSHIARLIGVTHSCVSKIMSRYRRTGSVQPRGFRVDQKEDTNDVKALKADLLPFSIERILAMEKTPETGQLLVQ